MSKESPKPDTDLESEAAKPFPEATESDAWDLGPDDACPDDGVLAPLPDDAADPSAGTDTPSHCEAWQAGITGTGSPPAAGMRAFLASLSGTEKIAVSSLFAGIAVAATLILIHFSERVPTNSGDPWEIDFPVSGKLIEITSATTYWRKPVTTGENPDIVRRGTALIPVVELTLHAKPSAIRVFFLDEEGTAIGDVISRKVDGDGHLVITGTAGFDDPGMHAAYRTGGKEPWIARVYEAPNLGSDGEDLRQILETRISTDIR